MRLSALQKYILKQCYYKKKELLSRNILNKFYSDKTKKPKKKDLVNIITKSLERLIDKELLVGYGVRTPHKWYIKNVRLTAKGKKIAKDLLGKQQKLPLKVGKGKVDALVKGKKKT